MGKLYIIPGMGTSVQGNELTRIAEQLENDPELVRIIEQQFEEDPPGPDDIDSSMLPPSTSKSSTPPKTPGATESGPTSSSSANAIKIPRNGKSPGKPGPTQ